MKDVLVSGCSHSVGYGLSKDEMSWVDILASTYNLKIKNLAQAGSSIEYSLNSITDELYSSNYDFIILQLTTTDRIGMPAGGQKAFFKDNIELIYNTINPLIHVTQATYLEACSNKEVPFGKEVVKYFIEEAMYSPFRLNSIANQLFLLQSFCKLKNIPLVIVPYDGYFFKKESPVGYFNLNFTTKIDKTLMHNKYFLDWLRENSQDENKYFLDKGFHLNAKGQQLFADIYLAPFLKRLNLIK